MYQGTCIAEINNAVDRATGTRAIYTSTAKMPVGFGVTPELHDRMTVTAHDCGTSMSELCRVAVTFYLEHLEGESGVR